MLILICSSKKKKHYASFSTPNKLTCLWPKENKQFGSFGCCHDKRWGIITFWWKILSLVCSCEQWEHFDLLFRWHCFSDEDFLPPAVYYIVSCFPDDNSKHESAIYFRAQTSYFWRVYYHTKNPTLGNWSVTTH